MFWFFEILDTIFKGTWYDILFYFSLINWIQKIYFEFPKFKNIILKRAIQTGKKNSYSTFFYSLILTFFYSIEDLMPHNLVCNG
jgi:hypothetical protein